MDSRQESKRLALQLKENEDKYISGEWNLDPILHRTDELYKQTSLNKGSSTDEYLNDSGLLQLEAQIARQSARLCRVNTLIFDPKAFSVEVKKYFGVGSSDESRLRLSRTSPHTALWTKLGEYSKDTMYLAPTFSFIYGTFDADPVEPIKRKRKATVRDKLGIITKPQSMDVSEVSGNIDSMSDDVNQIYQVFIKLTNSKRVKSMCFYEFVIDPTSFSRTIENIYLVCILLKNKYLQIFADNQGLPFLRAITQDEKKEDWSNKVTQCALTITVEDWMEIVKTFNFTSPIIAPRKTQNRE